jgi:flavin-dependent dehydrogenase
MSNSKRKVAIVGAGVAGTTAGLGFVNAGFDVTIYSDRDRASLRNDVPPTGTAMYYGNSLEYDAEIIEDLYPIGNTTGMSFSLSSGQGETYAPIVKFDAPFNYQAQAVDVRLRSDDRLGRFLARGGKFKVRSISLEDLDKIAAEADLTLVATGRGGLSSLFPVDSDRTVYAEPQRQLLFATFKGVDHRPDVFAHRSSEGANHSLFNYHTDFGELYVGTYLHKDVGATWALVGFAKPGSPWVELFRSITDTQSARDVVVDIYATYFPEEAVVVERFEPLHEDPHSWFLGAITPTVRRPVATTSGGHVVAAIGDTAISVDPIAAQGAQNAIVQVASLVRAAQSHEGKFTRDWLNEQFDKHWHHRGEGATEVTRLFLGDPKYAAHLELLLPAAVVNASVGTALFGFLSKPQELLDLRGRDDILKFISEQTGAPAEDILAKFKSPQELAHAKSIESVAVPS